EDKTLFLLAERHTRQKPISGTSILRKKDGESNQEDLIDMETEEVVDPDVEMEEDQNHQDQNNPSPKEKEPEGPPKIMVKTPLERERVVVVKDIKEVLGGRYL
ncbi:11121_t:CDS:2, partial [Scutellospora calospora]